MIGPSSHVSKFLLSLFFLLLVFFIFMDVNMYLRIQNYPIVRIESRFSSEMQSSIPEHLSEGKNFSITTINTNGQTSTLSTHTRSQRSSAEPGNEYQYMTWVPCSINPLCYPTVKALMLDHTNQYIFAPLVAILDIGIGISKNMPYITPNMISYSHVVLAIIAGKLVSIDSLAYRRLGVVLFQLRTFLDDLDGHVARSRKHIHGERSEVGTPGYFIDGICDLLGCIFLIVGIFYYLKNNPPRRGYVKVHTLLPHFNEPQNAKEPVDSNGEVGFVYKPKVSMEKMVRKILMFSGQLMLSSMAWNRYIDVYQETLERDDGGANVGQKQRQLFVFRSGFFFAIAWLWKIVNVHSLLHCILFAIFCDKLWEFFRFIQFTGYALLVASVCFTEMHVMKVQNYVYKTFVYGGAQS
ncbi:ceramide phosphoethanolamine synthase [Arctopsyche grandis]|uniref:ceramide phosphoethanolamine synthase n=1 Tax=Arctopsyche grandis TaxID=121162 RepID=UPI00406D9273